MANQYVNKVDLADGTNIMDISDTTAGASDVASGQVFYAANGARSVGTGALNFIDDTAGDGDTDKTWSADKLVDQFAAKSDNMVVLTYGTSTWNDFITAYNKKNIVYCAVNGRMAFMAYVNNATTPTNVEFQYYRSMSSHSISDQTDEVYVYKLTNGGTWSTTTRKAGSKVSAGTYLTSAYSSDNLTLSVNLQSKAAVSAGTAVSLVTTGEKYAWNNMKINKVHLSSVSSLPKTYSVPGLLDTHEVIKSILSVPEAQGSDWTITTGTDSLTISGTFRGTDPTDITLYFAVPQTLTATEVVGE